MDPPGTLNESRLYGELKDNTEIKLVTLAKAFRHNNKHTLKLNNKQANKFKKTN